LTEPVDYPIEDMPEDDFAVNEAREADDSPLWEPDARTPEPVDEPGAPSAPPARPAHFVPPIRRADAIFYTLLALVLAVSGWLRFDHQNWDDYTHLHPDERFLTEVVTLLDSPTLRFTDSTEAEQAAHRARCEARYPGSGLGGYFDAECSPLNPNNLGKGLYVYGEFPLFTTHAAGVARSRLSQDVHAFLQAFDPDAAAKHVITTHWEGYSGAQLIGRSVAALADWLTVLVLFLIGRRLYGRWVGLLAAGLYSFAALALQLSSFWTVDSFATFWVTLAIYFAIRALDDAAAAQGPRPLVYLALWAVAVGWLVGAGSLPVLGAVILGGLVLVALAPALLIEAWGSRTRSEVRVAVALPVAAAGGLASLLYLVAWLAVRLLADQQSALDMVGYGRIGLGGLLLGGLAVAGYMAAAALHCERAGEAVSGGWLSVTGALGWLALMQLALIAVTGIGGLDALPVVFLLASVNLLVVFDRVDLTDYVLFGAALGAAVATRINMAPLAGIIVLVAGIKLLPALLDGRMESDHRNRLMTHALVGVLAAALVSLVVFRVLQPHAFLGPGFFGLRINPGWQDDASEAAYLTSGDWDAPPNHQWANRAPYLFPLRNIILWGLGLPLGLMAWAAWAWAGARIALGRTGWARTLLPFVWVLVIFGWLGGRWVTTMRYFLPIYPMLVLLAAWALVELWERARRVQAARRARFARLGAGALLIVVAGWTVIYGLAFQNIHRHQLTRVAASRWFQETIPGDFGLWVEGQDGARQLVNIGRGYVAPAPDVVELADGQTVVFSTRADKVDPVTLGPALWTIEGEFTLSDITLRRLSDPRGDPEPEVIRVSLYRIDPVEGRTLLFEDTIREDLGMASKGGGAGAYGRPFVLRPEQPVILGGSLDPARNTASYTLEIHVDQGGPVIAVGNVIDGSELVGAHVGVTLVNAVDRSVFVQEFNVPSQPILTGHGDDIPEAPTHWTVGSSVVVQFPIPIDGTIRTVEIPHLGDVMRDDGEETLRLVLTGPDGATTSATLTADFYAGADPLGLPRTLTFDPPLTVQRSGADGAQQFATLMVEAQDPIYTSGPVIAWEGDWDDPVPWPTCPLPDDMTYRDDLPSGLSSYTCMAVGMYSSHYQGIKLWMSAEDNEQKRRAMQNALDQADYIVITSNRFYDSLSRIPYRWPMSMAYYRALFDGSLGFELVRTFESPPRLGPIPIRDQALPTDNLPDWVNEHWEAEEAFHVYDHPAVLVFRKTEAYSSQNTRFILEGVSIRSIATQVQNYIADAVPVNVIAWGAKRASEAPTLLMLPEGKQAAQTEGGTWADLFPRSNPLNQSQPLAVVTWWLLMIIAGWIAWPLLFVALPALPDRGYPAAKIAGWLVVAWIAWMGGTLDLRLWSRGGLLLILLALAAINLALTWRRRALMVAYLRANWRYLLAVEALTVGLFAVGLIVRLGNPDLWHFALGGEKPMDFAYFNAVLRSTVFPPLDPWFSGGYINYYYFGYVVVGAPVKLLGLNPSLAYNLIIPTLFAMTGIGVFTVAYNWVRARATWPGAVEGATHDGGAAHDSDGTQPGMVPQAAPIREARAPRGSAWAAGLLAVLLAVILGNLGEIHLLVTTIARMDGWERPALYDQYRREQVEARRGDIYQGFYDEEVARFAAQNAGREPSSDDQFKFALRAQERTEAYIKAKTEHPPILKQWAYDASNTLKQLRHFVGGLDNFFSGEQLPLAPNRWYWAPTRIINELPGGAGQNAIAEMPYFTFLYGDLHAHMMAFPITLLVLLWLLAEIMGAGLGLRSGIEAFAALALGGLAVGVLRPTNSWDWITYLLLGGAGLTFAAWLEASRASAGRGESRLAAWLLDWLRPSRFRETALTVLIVPPLMAFLRVAYHLLLTLLANQQAERGLNPGEKPIEATLTAGSILVWIVAGLVLTGAIYLALVIMARAHADRRVLTAWIGRVAGFVAISMVAAWPFTRYFATGYTDILPWERETTPLWAYLYIHGLFIFIVIAFLIWRTARWLRRVRVADLSGQIVPVSIIGGGLVVVVLGSLVWGARDVPVAALVVPLVAWAALLFFAPGQAPLVRAAHALIVLALAISLGVELVVLDGDIGRQNTVFKFYLQVWFLLSVVGGVALAWMLRAMVRWSGLWRGAWQVGLVMLIAAAALYPLLATQGRWKDRFDPDVPTTLDGMAYMQTAVHNENGISFSLRDDYALIRWLQDEITGTPVIAEGQMPGQQYRWAGRLSIYTGLPTILGWSWHQIQQHSLQDMDRLVHNRENNISALYQVGGEEGIAGAITLIRHYDIGYIVVGTLERILYGGIVRNAETGEVRIMEAAGLAKFDTMVERGLLEIVYDRAHCIVPQIDEVSLCPAEMVSHDVVYRVQRAAVDAAARASLVGAE